MTENQLVSVIIPIYNVAPYLRECLDSIISQSYTNLEIILVDDGSTDHCPQICDEYAQNDKRIIVIHKANGGLSDARNAGMKIATADYWTFVDSDDYCHPKMIETLLKPMLENKDIGASCCDCSSKKLSKRIKKYKVFDTVDYFLEKWGASAWSKMFRKELFDDIIFPIGKLLEDLMTIYKPLYKTKKIAYNDTSLYYYRIRSGSILHTHTNRRLTNDHKDGLIGCAKYFQDKQVQIYSMFLSKAAQTYSKYKTKGHPFYCENCDDILQLWKEELQSFSISSMNWFQKILFVYHIEYTKISVIVNHIMLAFQWCPFLVPIKRWLRF